MIVSLHMSGQRLRQVKGLTQGHTASNRQGQPMQKPELSNESPTLIIQVKLPLRKFFTTIPVCRRKPVANRNETTRPRSYA